MLYFRLVILVSALFLTGCDSSSSDTSTNNEMQTIETAEVSTIRSVSFINIYGDLPEHEKSSIEVIFDMNNNDVIDQNETDYKLLYLNLSKNYILNQINTYQASKMWITYSSNHKIPQTKIFDITTDSYNINIKKYISQERLNVKVKRDENNPYLIFLVKHKGAALDISYLYSPKNTTSNENVIFELSIPINKLSASITSINAYFNENIGDDLRRPHTLDGKKILLDITQSISYALHDQDNKPIVLSKKDILYKFKAQSKKIFLFDNQKLQKITSQGNLANNSQNEKVVASAKIFQAKVLHASEVKKVCVKVYDAAQNPIKSVLVEGHSPVDISSNYSDDSGEVILHIHQEIDQYNFDYTINKQFIYNKKFTVSPSTKNNCNYEATVTIDNSHLKTLNLTVIEENNASLEGNYIYAHNSDYSFYTYGYLDANNSIKLNVPKGEALTVVLGSQRFNVLKDETNKILKYTRQKIPKLYLYFEKDNVSDNFPKFYVMAVGGSLNDYVPSVEQVLQNYNASSILSLKQTEIYNAHKIWIFDVDEKLPLENDFNVILANGINEIKQTMRYTVEDYPTEIRELSFIDILGNKYTYTSNLYAHYSYAIEYDIFDKNNNIKSISNNISVDNQIIFSLQNNSITINVTYNNSNENFSKTIPIVILNPPQLLDNSNFPSELEYADLVGFTYTFNVDINDPLGYENNLTIAIFNSLDKVSDTGSYTYDFRNNKRLDLSYMVISPLGYSQIFYNPVNLVNYNPTLIQDFTLINISYLNTTVQLSIEAKDLADKPLAYTWFINDRIIGRQKNLEYTFENVEEHVIKCVITNEIGGRLEILKTTNVIEGVRIIDISEIKNTTLMGNYTFTVKAADVLGADVSYRWLVNGVEKSVIATLDISLLQDEEIVTIECIVSSIHGHAKYKKTTKVYYPKPIIQSPLENTIIQESKTKLFTINAINRSEIINDRLNYAWFVNNILVSNDEEYEYVQTDNNEHSIKCEVSNKYKSSVTQAKVGNVSLHNFFIKSLEGNKVYIYDDNMNIIQSFDVNESKVVTYSSIKSKLNASSVFTKDTVLTPLLFSKLITHGIRDSNHILDKRRISIRHINTTSRGLYGDLYYGYPRLYGEGEGMRNIYLDDLRSMDINGDEYLDINELYTLGLTKYDRDNDGKIKVKELRTYNDNNVTMKFAFIKKGLKDNHIDWGEEVFIPTFKEFSKISYINNKEVILYPKNEYIDINMSIYNIPLSFSNLKEWKVVQFFKVPDGDLSLLERTENTLNNTLTWKFNLKIHDIHKEEDYISFMLYHQEDIPNISYSSYYAKNIDKRSSMLSINYTEFSPMMTIYFEGRIQVHGEIVTKSANRVIQSGKLSRFGKIAYIDKNLLEYGLYFNIFQKYGGGWPQADEYTNNDNILFRYQKIFDLNSSNDVEEQYMNIFVEIEEAYDMPWIRENNIFGDDFLRIDNIKSLNYTYTREMRGNYFHYISIEEEIVHTVPIMNTNLCEQILGFRFCEGIDFNNVGGNVLEIQFIDYKDDTNQSINPSYRMKSFVREDRGH